MSKLSSITHVGWVDLPVAEASALATKMVNGRREVIVLGDRTWQIGVSSYTDAGFGEWRTIEMPTDADWPVHNNDSQFEAIAVDGGNLAAVMREDPPVVLVAEVGTRRLRAQITLTAPKGSPLYDTWGDPTSRGEGMVMLRDGRLLVAKEKRPAALIEFCPVGSSAQGLARDDFLDDGEAWDAPEGDVDFVAAAVWRLKGSAKRKLRDISDIAVGPDKTLWMLSDKSAAIAPLCLDKPLPASGGTIRSVDQVWRLPDGTTKPEGLTALGDRRILIAMDTDTTERNGMIVEFPAPRR